MAANSAAFLKVGVSFYIASRTICTLWIKFSPKIIATIIESSYGLSIGLKGKDLKLAN